MSLPSTTSPGMSAGSTVAVRFGHRVSVILPTLNERENIPSLFERLRRSLRGIDYEIIVVDDNSVDGTQEVVQECASADDRIKLIRRQNQRGLATAVIRGFQEAGGDLLVVMDADLQHPPESLPDLIRAVESEADLVIGSRYLDRTSMEGWSLARKLLSRGATWLANLAVPRARKIADPMSGFFLLKREVVSGVQLNPVGYKILLEVLARGKYTNVVEIPYPFAPRRRGESKLGPREELDYARHLLRLAEIGSGPKTFVKFSLVGLSGVVVNMGLLWILTEFAGIFYLVSAIVSIETSILSNFVLNDVLTFRKRRSGGIRGFVGRGLKFNVVSAGGLGINLGILAALTRWLGLHYLLANGFGIAAAASWNFFVNLAWTWKKRRALFDRRFPA